MVFDSLHSRCRERLEQKVELSFTIKHDRVNKLLFKLEMANIGTTLTKWAEEMKVGVPQGTREGVHHINTGSLGLSSAPEGPLNCVNAINSIQTCSVCGMRSHRLDNCHILINAVKCQDFIKGHPDVAERIRKSHKTFFRHKHHPSGTHVHNIMDDQPAKEDPTIQDDNTSLQFDADGYIYHLHDSPAAAQGGDESTSE
jgi:hypothetical protein